MLNRRTPREQQCCGNCTAFIGMGTVQQDVPGIGQVEIVMGVCCANPPVMLCVPVQTRSALDRAGGQMTIAPQPFLPPRRQTDWCRDHWELNLNVQMRHIKPGEVANVQPSKPN